MADKGVANGQARAIICARSRCQSIDRYENSMQQQRSSPIEYITVSSENLGHARNSSLTQRFVYIDETLPSRFLAKLELPSTW